MTGELDSGGSGGGGGDDDTPDDGGLIDDGTDLGLPDVLVSFANNPRRFIVGAVLTTILEGIFGIMSEILRIVQLFFVGSNPTASPPNEEVWGIADIIAGIFRAVGGAGVEGGAMIIRAVQSLNDPLYELAGVAGPAAPFLVAVIVSIEVVAVLLVWSTAYGCCWT